MTILELETLKELCLKYDKEKGSWPEHQYEGKTFFEYAVENSLVSAFTKVNLKEEYQKELKKVIND